jgi:hypothetical protein
MSKSKIGKINGMKGKTHKEESKLKTSKALEKKVIKIVNGEVNIWDSPKKVSDDLGITVKMVRYFCRKKDFSNKHNIMYLEDYEKTK